MYLQIFEDATTCYKALANHLETNNSSFFFGSKPSSVDAFLYGHLCLHLRAPTSAPELQKAVSVFVTSFFVLILTQATIFLQI